MKIGRNEPCPCNSGKKYKKCCWTKDAAADAARASHRQLEPSFDEPTLTEPHEAIKAKVERPKKDPEGERWESFWKRYEKASLDEKLWLAKGAIESEPELDGGVAFDLVESLCSLQHYGRVSDFGAVIDLVEQRHPDAFQAEAHWFDSWRVENALLTGTELRAPLMALAKSAAKGIDEFFRIVHRVMFYDHLDELVDAINAAWPAIKKDNNIMPYGKAELADIALGLEIEKHVKGNPSLAQDDAAFLAATKAYRLRDGFPWWQDYIEIRTGRLQPIWKRHEFVIGGDVAKWVQRVFLLTVQFSMWLWERRSWPRLRAELARLELCLFVCDRHDEKNKAGGPKARKHRQDSLDNQGPSPFAALISPESADRFLAGQLDMFCPGPYRAAAAGLGFPCFIDFLVELGLMDNGEGVSFKKGYSKRVKQLPKGIGGFTGEPRLVAELEAAMTGLEGGGGQVGVTAEQP